MCSTLRHTGESVISSGSQQMYENKFYLHIHFKLVQTSFIFHPIGSRILPVYGHLNFAVPAVE
jgi:hypothetical protein